MFTALLLEQTDDGFRHGISRLARISSRTMR